MKIRIEIFFVMLMFFFSWMVLFTRFPIWWKVIGISLYIGIILYSVAELWLQNRPVPRTLLWTCLLILLPVAGYIFYIYSGQMLFKGELFKSKRASDREFFEAIGKKKELDEAPITLNEHQRGFVSYLERVTLTNQSQNTKTKILKNGQETFQEVKQRLKEAKEFIHLEYYIFRYDRLGQELMEILTAKVKEGVEVRLIYDAFGSFALSEQDKRKMAESGIQVHPFLPLISGWFTQKFNFRNHRKIIVIDGKIGFVGGLNVGVEYLGEDDKFGFWCDTHVLLEGEAVQTLHAVFLLDWKYVCGEALFEDRRYLQPVPLAGEGLVHVVASGPETRDMGDHFYAMISSARKSIWIATPYFIPSQTIMTALRVAAKKGIQVRLMVPESNDGFLTQYATQSYFPTLLRAGIEIYTYQKGFLHKKVIIVDGNMATIGTANMDQRSFHLNFEVNLFLTGTSSIDVLASHFEEDLKECRRVRPVAFYKRGLGVKWKESFARLFSGVL
ncbi:cardiolipin synthase [Neobacillus sp. DY30]|uniref:cardiolipin synthase n=1 Tax=Neobacillus sp. DY30 TaxID=3047871 RepID=UPI0024C0035F|nr:cardiolipin synthase [Neobacillus sp. DY30]WHY00518.1 cardiolipin synthase [Neobacillus sp. DY30]